MDSVRTLEPSFIEALLGSSADRIYLQVHKAVDACKNVLRGLHSNRIAPRELDRVSVLSYLCKLIIIVYPHILVGGCVK